jgi:thiol-disulfide isomerase/thioredoxin
MILLITDSNEECVDCDSILEELENIDDDTDRHGIAFLKTPDTAVAEEFGVEDFPALIYFERGSPSIYEGDLAAEEDVLQWLILQKTEDRIELVNRDLLEVMIEETQYLAVFFCESRNPQ